MRIEGELLKLGIGVSATSRPPLIAAARGDHEPHPPCQAAASRDPRRAATERPHEPQLEPNFFTPQAHTPSIILSPDDPRPCT
jgi:hypothetical protein